MRDSTQIKKALRDDLIDYSDLLTDGHVDHFSIDPENLDSRDDIPDRHLCIYQGSRRPNVTVGAGTNYDTKQEFIIQVYVQYRRQKGSESQYEDLYADLLDDVFDWIQSLAEKNRIYTVSSTKLRTPRKEGLFTDQIEPTRTAKSTYTRIYIEPIRNKN